MPRRPCIECHKRSPDAPRRRCLTCQLRHAPIGEQVEACARRLAMVPPELRVKRGKRIMALAPDGTAWCAGCQSFRDLEDFGKGATQCRACVSAVAHGAMVAKVYGLTSGDYAALLAAQGGRCAICRARPKSKRLAVDHDHKTGAVRGLLCSRCNHDLLGAGWDSLAKFEAAWHYLNTPPATGAWEPPETAAKLEPVGGAVRPSKGLGPTDDGLVADAGSRSEALSRPGKRAVSVDGLLDTCEKPHYLPVGAISLPNVRGAFRVWVGEDAEPPF